MDEERIKEARKRIKELRDFYSHVGIFLITNFVLFLVDVTTGSGWWFYWPVLGWGIALAFHAYDVFFQHKFLGPAWEERKMRELLGEKPKRKHMLDAGDIPADYEDSIPVPEDDVQQQQSNR